MGFVLLHHLRGVRNVDELHHKPYQLRVPM
jgi:hypothetical protein